ncbi:MAG: hypothetical protein IOC86_04335 [Aestuariivirga sp.]|nr:hypothetical protein [Aestuariivirga sp.]
MGQGHAWGRDYRAHVMIDWDTLDDSEDGDLREYAWQDLTADVLACAAKTFWKSSDWQGEGRRDISGVARNWHFEIGLSDDGGRVHVLFAADPDNALAMANLTRASEAFFDRLARMHPLRVATSAWTSGPRA